MKRTTSHYCRHHEGFFFEGHGYIAPPIRGLLRVQDMKSESGKYLTDTNTVTELADYRRALSSGRSNGRPLRVMVEVACSEPEDNDIKTYLSRHLEELGYVLSEHRPDWVFSIIAMRHGTLVEFSVILRQFLRSTTPGTEAVPGEGPDQIRLRTGAWVYESLKFHGLFGVPRALLDNFLADLARQMVCEQMGGVALLKQE